MLERATLPAVNAALNSVAFVLLLLGWRAIRSGDEARHQRFMLSASSVSALFLCSYLTHHALFGSTLFTGQGWPRTLYFVILISHVVLATGLALLVPMTLYRAFKGQREQHRRVARVTLPVWLYVSVTGVVVYVMLYRMTWSS